MYGLGPKKWRALLDSPRIWLPCQAPGNLYYSSQLPLANKLQRFALGDHCQHSCTLFAVKWCCFRRCRIVTHLLLVSWRVEPEAHIVGMDRNRGRARALDKGLYIENPNPPPVAIHKIGRAHV